MHKRRTQFGEIYLQSLLFLFCFTLSSLFTGILKVSFLEELLMSVSVPIKPGFCGQELLSLQHLLVKKKKNGEEGVLSYSNLLFPNITTDFNNIQNVWFIWVSLSPRNFVCSGF